MVPGGSPKDNLAVGFNPFSQSNPDLTATSVAGGQPRTKQAADGSTQDAPADDDKQQVTDAALARPRDGCSSCSSVAVDRSVGFLACDDPSS